MKHTTVPPMPEVFNPPIPTPPGKTRTGSFQSRRKMITMWIFLVLGWVIVFAHMGTPASAPESRSTPPAVAQAPAPVILPPTATLAPLPAPLPTLPPVDQPTAEAAPLTSFGDGTYDVSTKAGIAVIMPGTYKTTGAPSDSSMGEYWERAKNDSQSLDSIIGNDYFKGPGKMTVKSGEVVSVSGGATWTRVGK